MGIGYVINEKTVLFSSKSHPGWQTTAFAVIACSASGRQRASMLSAWMRKKFDGIKAGS
jgi:hypothetical protein